MSQFSSQIHIVVAEDDALTRTLITRILTSQGFIVKEAALAGDAYKAVDEHVKLILVDIGLPDFDGQNLVQRLRRRYPKERLKICFATSVTDKETIKRSLEIGGDDYMVKPIDKDVLLQKVTKLLGQQTQQFAWVGADCSASILESPVQPDLKVVRVSETGLMLKSSARIVVSSAIRIDCPTLSQAIGSPLNNTVQKVTVCDKQGGNYFISTEFVGLTEGMAQPLRGISIRGQFLKDPQAVKNAS